MTPPGDVLTYTLTLDGTDVGKYRIDQATGQITVGPRTMLDRGKPTEATRIRSRSQPPTRQVCRVMHKKLSSPSMT